MIACYDLSRNPPTYDVVAFLAHAEIERLRRKDEAIELNILPGPAGGFRHDDLWPYSIDERVALQKKVLLPLCRLLPSVQVLRVADNGSRPEVFGTRERYISLPAILSALKVGCRPLRAVDKMPAWPGLVTFTLREADHHKVRNSRTDEWVAAARVLRSAGHSVVVVRDTVRAFEPLDGVPTSAAASTDVFTRASLYAAAVLNVGICNGPMWMSIFMGAPTLMLRPTTNAAGGCYDDAFYAQCGLPRGAQLPSSPHNQRLAWEDDTCDNIVRAVEGMLEVS